MLRAAGGGGGGGSVAIGDVTGLGTGVATALAVNIGSAGAPVVLNGAGGTPSSLTGTNITGIPPAGVTGTAAILGANTFTALQTITQASANAGVIASTGYSLTGSNATSMIDLAGTWNTSGNPTSLKIAMTNTASGSTTKFASFLAGAGGATEVFNVDKDGKVQSAKNGPVNFSILVSGQNEVGIGRNGSVGGLSIHGGIATPSDSNAVALFSGATGNTPLLRLDSAASFGWASSNAAQNFDLLLTRSAEATLQQGAANAASPVAQTLQAQGSRSGTDTNVAGASYTVRSGAGTGNATPSTLILQSYVAVASGTGAQTATTGATINTGGVDVGVGGLSFPTSDPAIAGRWWDNAGVLTKSAG